MTKTLLDIPDELMADAMELFGTPSKAETVRVALAEGVRRRRSDARLRADVIWSRFEVATADDLGEPAISAELADELVAGLRADRDGGR